MPINVIITLTINYDVEVMQGAAALFYKIKSKEQDRPDSRVVWFNTTLAGAADAITFTHSTIWDFQQGSAGHAHSAIYIIGHGAGGKMAGVPDVQLVRGLEAFLQSVLHIPLQCEFEKLCLLACNIGKLNADKTGPSYLAALSANFKDYRFRKIVAWNSWVTVFTFQHLAQLCAENAAQIEEYYLELIEEYSAFGPGLPQLNTIQGMLPPFKKALADKIREQLKHLPVEQLLGLVGRRLVEVASTPRSKQFSSPSHVGIPLPRLPVASRRQADFRSNRPVTTERLIRPMLMKQLADEAIVKLILQYAADWGWSYDPQQSKLCLICPEVAAEVGLPNF